MHIESRVGTYLQASCRPRGTSGSDRKDSASSGSCRYDNCGPRHKYTPSCSALCAWRSPYRTRTSGGRSGIRTLCRHTLDTVPRSPPWYRVGRARRRNPRAARLAGTRPRHPRLGTRTNTLYRCWLEAWTCREEVWAWTGRGTGRGCREAGSRAGVEVWSRAEG